MKKGFTLIELLAVLVIIGVIAMIAVPAIGNSINNSKEKAYDEQIHMIENAARTYMSKNSKELPDTCTAISIEQLQQAGFLSNQEIKNPKESNENIEGYVIITFTSNKYTYKYSESDTCS